MKRGDRMVVLATERRGEMVDVSPDGRVLVRLDGDAEPVPLAPHAVAESWRGPEPWL